MTPLHRFRLQSWLLLPLFICTSCIYEPDGENLVKIEKPNLSLARIDLNTAADTIFMHQSVYFTFEAAGIQGTPESFDVYVDDVLYESGVLEGDGYKGSFTVYAGDIGASGYHTLRVELHASSGTGSLGDRAGLEKVTVHREWVIELDITKPDPLHVTVDTLQGTLTLDWQAYSHRTFQKYIVTKKCRDDRGEMQTCKVIEIEDYQQNSWTDTEYIGGKAIYQVDIAASIWWVNGTPIEIHSEPGLHYVLEDRTLKIQWKKIFYHHNLTSMLIRKNNVPQPTISDFTQTEYITTFSEYAFGNEYSNGVQLIVKGLQNSSITYTIPFFIGKKITTGIPAIGTSFSDFRYNANVNRYFGKIWIDQRLYFARITPSLEVEMIKEIYPQYYTLSADGQHGYMAFAIANEPMGNHRVHSFDPITLDTARTFSVTDKFGIAIWLGIPKTSRVFGKMMASDNGLLSLQSMSGNFTMKLPSTDLVTTNYYSITSEVKPLAFSADGKYVFDNGALYEITNGAAVSIGNYPVSGVYLADFRSDKPNELIIMKPNGNILILDVTSMNVRTIAIGQNFALNHGNTLTSYDPVSGYLLLDGESGNNYMVHLDSETFFRIAADSRLFVGNNKVIATSGYAADIDQLKSIAP